MKVRAQLRDEVFWDVPRQLPRQALARLISTEPDEIALCADSDRGLFQI
jgi:hypothetical protein